MDAIVKKQPILITDAARSQNEQFRSRQIRYVTMMGLRAACLIAGAVLISVRPPWLGVWLVLCALGMVFLPWAAVLIANDRPARSKAERAAAAARREHEQTVLRELEADQADQVEYLTIDLQPTDAGERWQPADPEQDRRQR
jgi:arginine exporter protein ArgO